MWQGIVFVNIKELKQRISRQYSYKQECKKDKTVHDPQRRNIKRRIKKNYQAYHDTNRRTKQLSGVHPAITP